MSLLMTTTVLGCAGIKARPLTHVIVFPNPQQPEGGPCGDEPRREEADAGEVPQHEQV